MRVSASEWRRLLLAGAVSGSASAWPFLEVSIISPYLSYALGVFLIRYFPGFAFGIAAMRLPLWSGARAWRRAGFVAICMGCFHVAWWITVSFVYPLARNVSLQLSVTALVGGVASTLLMMVALSVLVRGYRPLTIIGVACASGVLDSALMGLWTLDGIFAARDVNTFASRTGCLIFFVGAQAGMLAFMRLALRKPVVDTGSGPPRRWPTAIRLVTGAASAAVVAVALMPILGQLHLPPPERVILAGGPGTCRPPRLGDYSRAVQPAAAEWLADRLLDRPPPARTEGPRIALRFDPNVSDVALSADGSRAVAVGAGGMVRVTADGGRTWRAVDAGTRCALSRVFLAPDGGRAVAVGERGTILLSSNGGASWRPVESSTREDLAGLAHSADGKIEVAYGGRTVLHSVDGGAAWRRSSIAFPPDRRFGVDSVSLSADGRRGLLLVRYGALYTSKDDGATWTLRRPGAATPDIYRDGYFPRDAQLAADGVHGIAFGPHRVVLTTSDSGQTWKTPPGPHFGELWNVQLGPDGRSGFAAEYDRYPCGLLTTTDGGATWRKTVELGDGKICRELLGADLASDGKHGAALVNDGMILTTSDTGQSWQWHEGLTANNLRHVRLSADGQGIIAVGDGGAIVVSGDGGETWRLAAGGTAQPLHRIEFVPGTARGVALGARGTIVTTSDGGHSWRERTSGTTARLDDLRFSPGGSIGIAVGERGTVVVTRDGGRTWERRSSGTNENLVSVGFWPGSDRVVAVGSQGLVLVSDDGGATWEARTAVSNKATSHPQLELRPLWAGYMRGGMHVILHGPDVAGRSVMVILTSSDGGLSWQRREVSGFPPIAAARPLPHGGGLVVVGANGRIMRSRDGGFAWRTLGSGTRAMLRDLWVSPDGRFLVAVGDDETVVTSADGGRKWRMRTQRTTAVAWVDTLLAEPNYEWSPFGLLGSIGHSLARVAFSPDGRRGIALGTRVLLTTSDGGLTWRTAMHFSRGENSSLVSLSDIAFSPDGRTAVAVGARGLRATFTWPAADGGGHGRRRAP